MTRISLQIPHDIIVLRAFIYGIGDRDWTDTERDHVLDLTRAIWRRRARRKTR
jgi:hypothetical protein